MTRKTARARSLTVESLEGRALQSGLGGSVGSESFVLPYIEQDNIYKQTIEARPAGGRENGIIAILIG